jgi:uncharacterized membrane protein
VRIRITASVLVLALELLPQTATAESGYAGLLGGVSFILLVFFVAPVALLVMFVWRSIRRGKHEGHAEYKRKEAERPPIGRLGE